MFKSIINVYEISESGVTHMLQYFKNLSICNLQVELTEFKSLTLRTTKIKKLSQELEKHYSNQLHVVHNDGHFFYQNIIV
jgi:hypothetical protein